MKDNYDFSKSIPNPYVKKLKRQISIRLDIDTLGYFKEMAQELEVPYQSLINQYLRACVTNELKPQINWSARKKKKGLSETRDIRGHLPTESTSED